MSSTQGGRDGTPVQLTKKADVRGHISEWPDTGLQIIDWMPTAFQQFIFKLHSRCNLACNYCYIYEMADSSWRSKPSRMESTVITTAADQIARHAAKHNLATVDIVLHGGEPLLIGENRLRECIQDLRSRIENCTITLQTNGLLLSRQILEMLAQHNVTVGVSLDGDQKANDRHRLTRGNASSYQDVADNLHLLSSEFPQLFSGILCVIDLENDPVETYEALAQFSPLSVDFMFPHGNWSELPPGFRPDYQKSDQLPLSGQGIDKQANQARYADWLIAIFDHWMMQDTKVHVRLFEEIIRLLLGGDSRVESIGLSPAAMIVVETGGTLEQVDVLKSAFEGAPNTGLNIFDHDFDTVLSHPSIVARQLRRHGISKTCRQCDVGNVCGGGYYPHRYESGSGFLNPSVYCQDLFRLINHISSYLVEELRKGGINVLSNSNRTV